MNYWLRLCCSLHIILLDTLDWNRTGFCSFRQFQFNTFAKFNIDDPKLITNSNQFHMHLVIPTTIVSTQTTNPTFVSRPPAKKLPIAAKHHLPRLSAQDLSQRMRHQRLQRHHLRPVASSQKCRRQRWNRTQNPHRCTSSGSTELLADGNTKRRPNRVLQFANKS